MPDDIERLRRDAPLHRVAQDMGVNLEKDGDEWSACCPFHDERTPSFTIFRGQDGVERFQCFGCGERGDVVDFVRSLKGVETREAIAILGGSDSRPNLAPRNIQRRDIYGDLTPIVPTVGIQRGQRVSVWNPKRERWSDMVPSMVFPYRQADGTPLGYVLRRDLPDGGKETPMVCRVKMPDGGEAWARYPFPKPRPLYRGEALREGQVIVVEGEKCADAMVAATKRQAVSWPGGTYGVAHVDWSPLAGRSVVIWPDADGPGLKTALTIAMILVDLGCTVKIVDVTGAPEGWDVADAVAEGWDKARIDGYMKDRVRPFVEAPASEATPPAAADPGPPEPPPREPEPERAPPVEPEVDTPEFRDALEFAQALNEFDLEGVDQVLRWARSYDKVQQDHILRAVKRSTNVGMTVLRDQMRALASQDGEEGGGVDHLQIARWTVEDVGPENVVCAGPFVWLYDPAGVWRQEDDRLVKQRIQRVVEAKGLAVMDSLVNGVCGVLKNEIYAPRHRWNLGDSEAVNCRNGMLIHRDGGWSLEPHDRALYRTTQIPVEYDPAATAPRFSRFLAEIFEGDEDADQKISALLEMLGYSLVSHALHERFLILIGEGSNGKSVLLAVLEALVGAENTAGVQPSQFDRAFMRAHLDQKLANIVTEIRQGEVIADAELKGIVSGERSTVEHKFQDPFDMHPFATCWFGTNHMPHTRDFSDALFRRALILRFNVQFGMGGRPKDPALKRTLLNELPGILNMALAAYSRACREGFTDPPSSEEDKARWRLEADQVAMFVEERCERLAGLSTTATDLFEAYGDWARASGVKKTLTMKGFRDRLTRLGFGTHRDSQSRHVTGVRLRSEFLPGGW